jgi:hypothetical protein
MSTTQTQAIAAIASLQVAGLAPNGPQSITSLTTAGTVATAVTASLIGIIVGAQIPVTIAGATTATYNGTVTATITGPSAFTYPIASGTATPATGTITYELNASGLPNPGPGLSANLARLNGHLIDGNNGSDPNAYAQIVTEVNRYLAFPV